MIDKKILDLVVRLIRPDFEERTEQLQGEVARVQNDAAVRGMGTSGPVVQLVNDLCGREIDTRTIIVWERLRNVLLQSDIQDSEELAEDLKSEMRRHGDFILKDPSDCFNRVVRTVGIGIANPISRYYHRALAKVDPQIDLFVLWLSRRGKSASAEGGNTFQIGGDVGIIQTGSGATAHLVFNLSSQDRESIAQALEKAKSDISACETLPREAKEQTLEIVEDAKTEAGKTKPNPIKLRSFLRDVATTIQTISSLQSAYRALKDALALLGTLLP
jgi:hypothetical protein